MELFGKEIKWQWIAVVVFLVFFFMARGCEASTDLEMGVTFQRGQISAGQIMVTETLADKYSAGIGLVGEQNTVGNTRPRNMFVQVRRDITWKKITLGLGVALFQHTDGALGSVFNFTEMIRYTHNHFIISFHHWSNAGTASPNNGHDALLVGYQW